MNHPEFVFRKSCRADIVFKDDKYNNVVMNKELIRYAASTTAYTDKSNYVHDLFKKTKILERKDQFVYATCELPNIIRHVKRPLDERVADIEDYGAEAPHFVCRVTEATQSSVKDRLKIAAYPEFFIDMMLHDDPNHLPREISEMYIPKSQVEATKFASDFYQITPEYVILPDITSGNFHTSYLEVWTKLKNNLYQMSPSYVDSNLYNLLSVFGFTMFLRDTVDGTKPYPYQDIFMLTKEKVLQVKQAIIDFLKTKFYGRFWDDAMHPDMVQITINADTKYNFVVFQFTMYNPNVDDKYVSFVDAYRGVDIEDFLMLERNELNYFTRVPVNSEVAATICKGNFDYERYVHRGPTRGEQDGGGTLHELLGDYEVIGERYRSNKVHSYCSEFFVIRAKGKTYRMSIKSITYAALTGRFTAISKHHLDTFKDAFMTKFWDVLGSSKYDVIDNGRAGRMIFSELPALFEMYIEENDYHEMTQFTYMETAEDYKKVVDYLTVHGAINPGIIITNVWKSEFRRLKDQGVITSFDDIPRITSPKYTWMKDLTNSMLKNPHLALYILDEWQYTQSFILNTKTFENNLKVLLYPYCMKLAWNDRLPNMLEYHDLLYDVLKNSNHVYNVDDAMYRMFTVNDPLKSVQSMLKASSVQYLIWYCPSKLGIKDGMHTEFIKLIDSLNTVERHKTGYADINKAISTYKQSLDEQRITLKPIFSKLTNFYDLYSDSKTFVYNMRHVHHHEDEIDALLYFVRKKHRVNLLAACHYPLLLKNTVFHLHVYYPGKGHEEDAAARNFNQANGRYYIWDKEVKGVNFKNKNLLVKYYTEVANVCNEINNHLMHYAFMFPSGVKARYNC